MAPLSKITCLACYPNLNETPLTPLNCECTKQETSVIHISSTSLAARSPGNLPYQVGAHAAVGLVAHIDGVVPPSNTGLDRSDSSIQGEGWTSNPFAAAKAGSSSSYLKDTPAIPFGRFRKKGRTKRAAEKSNSRMH